MSKNDSSERKEADKGIRKMQFRPADTHTDHNSIGGEGRFKQMGALMPHCLSKDTYLLLGSSPAFPAFRCCCCCLLRKKNSARLKNTRAMGGAWLCIFLFSSVKAEKFGGLVQKNPNKPKKKNWCYKRSYLQGVLPLSACRWQ